MPDDSREFNEQPDWLGNPVQQSDRSSETQGVIRISGVSFRSPDSFQLTDSTNIVSNFMERPLFGSIGLGSFSINVGQEHCPIHNTVDEFISFNFERGEGREEKYCMRCIRDLIRERLIPLGEEYVPPPIQENPPVLKSRYDLLREKNGTRG